jgi:hypothetical protein
MLVSRSTGKHMLVRTISLLSGALLMAPVTTVAANDAPIRISNLSPLAALRGLPTQRDADVQLGSVVTVSQSLSNHFSVEESGDESLMLDGQTDVLSVSLRYAFDPDWDIEITLPWVQHSRGFMDPLISDWHAFFGLPNGDREDYPVNQLRYRLDQPRHEAALNNKVSGLGDVKVALSRNMRLKEGSQVALSVGMKAATGEEADWLGSGATDYWALARVSGDYSGRVPLVWHGQLGMTRAGVSDLMGPNQKRSLWFGGVSLEWPFRDKWSVLAQIDAHSALGDGNLSALSRPAALLSMALRWQTSPKWTWDLGFSEDLVVESAPDITLMLTARYVASP